MRFKVKKNLAEDVGIVYLLYMWVEDEMVVKIGVTSRRIEDRVIEILTSYFYMYRLFPKLYPKRYRQARNVYVKEAMLHKYFSKYKYRFSKKFSGSTEYFKIDDEKELLRVYEDCMNGVDINDERYSTENGEIKVRRSSRGRAAAADSDGKARVPKVDVEFVGVVKNKAGRSKAEKLVEKTKVKEKAMACKTKKKK